MCSHPRADGARIAPRPKETEPADATGQPTEPEAPQRVGRYRPWAERSRGRSPAPSAADEFFELMNPKIVLGEAVPEVKKDSSGAKSL